jgi:hypothetical protein
LMFLFLLLSVFACYKASKLLQARWFKTGMANYRDEICFENSKSNQNYLKLELSLSLY